MLISAYILSEFIYVLHGLISYSTTFSVRATAVQYCCSNSRATARLLPKSSGAEDLLTRSLGAAETAVLRNPFPTLVVITPMVISHDGGDRFTVE